MKRKILYLLIILIVGDILTACKDFLDVVPDNIATIDNAFSDRNEAEKYLFTCYSYIPNLASSGGNVALMGGDELWTYYPANGLPTWDVARGNQNVNDPFMNYWDGANGGSGLYKAIRDCNIFLENVSDPNKVTDLEPLTRQRWLGEVQFLKAYYHFYLFRMYGPIILIDENLPIDATPEEVRLKRAPVDSVVNFISNLLDTAAVNLPEKIINQATELGRVTKPAALTLKARLWVTAASPLFNGNPDYVNFVDKDNIHLFPTEADPAKWNKAVEACKEAVEACENNDIRLYTFSTFLNLSETTKTKMSVRNSVTEKWSAELIWGLSGRRGESIQWESMARIDPQYPLNIWGARDLLNPTLNVAELFYSANGVPINEDKMWNYANRYEIVTADHEDRFNLVEGYESAAFHHNREPRFYADLAFDGSTWYLQNSPSGNDENTWTVKARVGGPQARLGAYNFSVTGFWPKKLVNWKYELTADGSNYEAYPWPEMRLADLYLLYAEALNETGQTDQAIVWVDKVRERAGLNGVKDSWTNFSTNPGKFSSIEGMREIIHRERAIELIFEGHRFWDLRRWKKAEQALNQNIRGWNIEQESPEGYYHPQILFNQRFISPRDYLWPLREHDLIVNPNLVQNPGW